MNGGYFARLAQRATGTAQANGASPLPQRPSPGGEAPDPFDAKAPAELEPPSLSIHPREVAAAPHPIETRNAERAFDAPELPHARPTPLVRATPEPIPIPPPSIPVLEPQAKAEERVEQVLIEHRAVEKEVSPEQLQPPNQKTQIEPDALPTRDLDKREGTQLLPKLERGTHMQIERIERITETKAELPRLEPPTTPPSDTQPRIAEPTAGPRLVIGQMRVEVVPVAQQTVQPIKVRPRSRERVRQPDDSSHSRLQFGLGQM